MVLLATKKQRFLLIINYKKILNNFHRMQVSSKTVMLSNVIKMLNLKLKVEVKTMEKIITKFTIKVMKSKRLKMVRLTTIRKSLNYRFKVLR